MQEWRVLGSACSECLPDFFGGLPATRQNPRPVDSDGGRAPEIRKMGGALWFL